MKHDVALVAVMDGLDTTSRVDPAGDAPTSGAQASPSYVQSILFGRRWMRKPIPGSSPETRPTSEGKVPAVNEQERIEPCAS
jgi:hypothetical protein